MKALELRASLFRHYDPLSSPDLILATLRMAGFSNIRAVYYIFDGDMVVFEQGDGGPIKIPDHHFNQWIRFKAWDDYASK